MLPSKTAQVLHTYPDPFRAAFLVLVTKSDPIHHWAVSRAERFLCSVPVVAHWKTHVLSHWRGRGAPAPHCGVGPRSRRSAQVFSLVLGIEPKAFALSYILMFQFYFETELPKSLTHPPSLCAGFTLVIPLPQSPRLLALWMGACTTPSCLLLNFFFFLTKFLKARPRGFRKQHRLD